MVAIVVIAWHQVVRQLQATQQLSQPLILGLMAKVGEVTGEDQGIGLLRQPQQRIHGGREIRGGIEPTVRKLPGLANMRIAHLREECVHFPLRLLGMLKHGNDQTVVVTLDVEGNPPIPKSTGTAVGRFDIC